MQELLSQHKTYEQAIPSNPERDELILEHLPQIKYIAQRISTKLPSHVELNDLVSAGILGLLDAIDRHQRRAILNRIAVINVDADDLARDRRRNLAHGFHGFNDQQGLALFDL